jgi:hypothetical protein
LSSEEPVPPPCAEFQESLLLFFDGELQGAERDRFVAHLEVCERCRAACEELARAEEAFPPLIGASTQVPAAQARRFEERFEAACRDRGVDKGRGKRKASWPWLSWSLAALILVGVAAGALICFVFRDRFGPSPSTPVARSSPEEKEKKGEETPPEPPPPPKVNLTVALLTSSFVRGQGKATVGKNELFALEVAPSAPCWIYVLDVNTYWRVRQWFPNYNRGMGSDAYLGHEHNRFEVAARIPHSGDEHMNAPHSGGEGAFLCFAARDQLSPDDWEALRQELGEYVAMLTKRGVTLPGVLAKSAKWLRNDDRFAGVTVLPYTVRAKKDE